MRTLRRLVSRRKKKQVQDGSDKIEADDRVSDAGGAYFRVTDDTSYASNHMDTAERIGLQVLSNTCEKSNSGVDIVFVHGLRGSRIRTWSTADVCWPRDLLPKDVADARILTWGYDSSVANLFTQASQEKLFGHAETLLNDLARDRTGVTRPIIFICHSLGGLVVKQSLITAATYKSYNRHPTLGEIFSRTCGVVFFGTPHRGSGKATLGELVGAVAKLSFRQPNSQLLQTLKPDSGILENQRDQFTTISNDLDIVCIREELPTGIGIIVPESSASYDGFKVRRNSIHSNHMDMVKFGSAQDEGYRRTLSHIQELVSAATKENISRAHAMEAWVIEILRAIEFADMRRREADIDPEYEGTYSWIFKPEHSPSSGDLRLDAQRRFVSWLRDDNQIIWISGRAGCGKSTLMKFLYTHEQTKKELLCWAPTQDLVMAACFFFERGHELQKSREGMLRSILHQLLSVRRDLVPVVFQDLVPTPTSDVYSSLTGRLKWNELTMYLQRAIEALHNSKLCLFIDGLDEFRMMDQIHNYKENHSDMLYDNSVDASWGIDNWVTEGHKEVTRLVHQLANQYTNIKLCVSSRELLVFDRQFDRFPRLRVHEMTFADISRYCHGKLDELAPDLEDKPEFAHQITEKSQGIFLWVRIVVGLVADGNDKGDSKDELLELLKILPVQLRDLYRRMIHTTVARKDLGESKRLFQLALLDGMMNDIDIMALFLAAEGHLDQKTGNLLAKKESFSLKSWENWKPRWQQQQRRLKSRCAGLLEGTTNVDFIHQTAKEFILQEIGRDEIFSII